MSADDVRGNEMPAGGMSAGQVPGKEVPVGEMSAPPPDETPDLNGAYPRLSPGQIDMLARSGARRRTFEEGERLFVEGETCERFLVILRGSVVVVKGPGSPDEQEIRVHGPGRFLGELGLLEGRAAFYTVIAREPGDMLTLTVDRLRELVVRETDFGDLVLQACLVRRELHVGEGVGFQIIGSGYSGDSRRLREFAARNQLPYRWTDLERDHGADALLSRFGLTPEKTPVVLWGGRHILRNPGNAELAALIGVPATGVPPDHVRDLLVVGAGPAGLAAAVYGASEGLTTAMVDSVATGGQAATSARIENYLGFPTGISGGGLVERAVVQARKFGVAITVPAKAIALRESDGHYVVTFADGTEAAGHHIVVATGAHYRRLTAPGVERLEGGSVHYTATLEEVRQCGDNPVAVVGAGNSAGEAALFLARFTPNVQLLLRGGELGASMSRYLVDQIERHPRVEVRPHTEVREAHGRNSLEALTVENNRTGERSRTRVRALFVFIGVSPHTGWLRDTLPLDERGFVLCGPDAFASTSPVPRRSLTPAPLMLETALTGVFAAGDVRGGSVKRVASAVGEGAMAVRLIQERRAREGFGPP
ncbi:FAD-dependent oxidoreductase [Streptomyces sp. NBC_01716]|uniref:FAD-dependent oxidoreductase n=1 Tax=Streptomyces sp. NBC_01716 TaxID=2975917 RepID=UPI002E365579|nr:FAD-dependent oxidoreductase [Streptomyces sp. NBC_01716]